MRNMKVASSIDEYIKDCAEEVQPKMQQIRKIIRDLAPEAKETISYGIPTFKLNGNLVHFAAFRDHISFFPTSAPVEKFKEELKDYKTSKGTIWLKLDEPIPVELIKKIVKYRIKSMLK